MSADLLPVWSEIEKYLEWGVSVIPVRDRDDSVGVAKSPFGKSWTKYQTEIITKDALFELMDVKYDTVAIGVIGGAVSGNLEIIDIDVKYKPGIDATLFMDLKTLYPDLAPKLRIHRTPSGGYHILYRCEAAIQGNQKLAGRAKTAEELEISPRPKTVNFLETRGEGGYACVPPANGYVVVKNNPLPVLTKAERDSLISLCRSYNELVEVERPKPVTVAESKYYDTTPFEDYNNRVDPTSLLESLGYKYLKSNSQFIWYTRPGKTKGVSISFNQNKRFFFNFTASTDLEEYKGYSPVNLLGRLQFLNDKKALYNYLVDHGYGTIRPEVEKKIAKSAAINGKELPKNVSNEALLIKNTIIAAQEVLHPHGLYWIDDIEKGIIIDRELLLFVSGELGFKLYADKLVYTDGKFVEEVKERFFFDTLKQYIHEEDAQLYRDICNAYEIFIEKHGRFLISRLPILEPEMILSDTIDASFKVYRNGIIKITKDNIQHLASVPQLIWKHAVRQRDYTFSESGKYLEFLNLATDLQENKDYIYSVIGYLAHEYKDETAGYIIVLTEQCENPKEGGGAGKNVFAELFKETTTLVSKPGSQVKFDEKFLQSWNGQKIFSLSDVPKNFPFAFLKELSTGTGLMKKLFKDESEVLSADMPKFLIGTNFSYEIADGGLRRRIKQIEFTDFFTNAGGLDVYFNAHFPKGWDANDWACYDTVIAKSIQTWLLGGRKIGSAALSQSGWLKQFEQTWGSVIYHFIKESYEEWVKAGWVSNDNFKKQLDQYYVDNQTTPTYRPSMQKINSGIKDWCLFHNIQYDHDFRQYNGVVKERGKYFGEPEVPF